MHIFVSYSKKDSRDLAEELFDILNNTPNISAWMDKSLLPVSSWAQQIQDEIDKCDYLVVLVSSDVNRKESETQARSFVLNEIDYARQLNKRIIPLLVEKTRIPVQLSGLEYIDVTVDRKNGIVRLLSTLDTLMEGTHVTVGDTVSQTYDNTKQETKSNSNQIQIIALLFIIILTGIVAFGIWQYALLNNSTSQPENRAVLCQAIIASQNTVSFIESKFTLDADYYWEIPIGKSVWIREIEIFDDEVWVRIYDNDDILGWVRQTEINPLDEACLGQGE